MFNWQVINHYSNNMPIDNPYELEKFDFRNGGADIRDYMILRIDKETWLLYHTGIEKGTGAASITVYESKNGLTNWKYKGEAFEISLANYQYEGKNIKQNGSFFISSLFYEDSDQETFKVGGVVSQK